jgi:hypothetical protein
MYAPGLQMLDVDSAIEVHQDPAYIRDDFPHLIRC